MATPEKKVKDAIKKLLFDMDCWFYMPVPSGYGEATLDFLCSYKGRAFAIEAKAPGKILSPRQAVTVQKMFSHGVPCNVIDSVSEDCMMCLRAWILMVGEGNFIDNKALVDPPPIHHDMYATRGKITDKFFGGIITDIEKIKDE